MLKRFIPLVCSIFLVTGTSISETRETFDSVRTEANDGYLVITISGPMNKKISHYRKILQNISQYPLWLFNGMNKLNRSKLYWLKEKNLRYIRKKGVHVLSFEYDVKFLFLRYQDTLKLRLNPSPQDESNFQIQATVITPTHLVKEGKGTVSFFSKDGKRASTTIRLTVKPPAFLYTIMPKGLVNRVVSSRLGQIIENLESMAQGVLAVPGQL